MIEAIVRFAFVVMVAAAAEAGEALVPEPDAYRLGDYRAPTPATLQGARVIGTDEAETIWRSHSASFVDVLPRAPRPRDLHEGTLWRDKPRPNIPGGIWLPDTGYDERAENGWLFLEGPGKGDKWRSRQNSGCILPGGLLDVVERRQARALARLF
jgi:hypothetical protein